MCLFDKQLLWRPLNLIHHELRNMQKQFLRNPQIALKDPTVLSRQFIWLLESNVFTNRPLSCYYHIGQVPKTKNSNECLYSLYKKEPDYFSFQPQYGYIDLDGSTWRWPHQGLLSGPNFIELLKNKKKLPVHEILCLPE